MTYDQLPQHWRDWISAHAAKSPRSVKGRLEAGEFPFEGVRLHFEDGSEVSFKYAFFVEDRERKELAVFTEHCGYHVFPLTSLEAFTGGPPQQLRTLM